MADEKPYRGRTIHPLFIPFGILLTLDIYWFVWLYRRYAEIRQAKFDATKVTPARAIGFLFIPVFNLYWVGFIAYDFARALARVQAARVARALVWPYTIMILFIGGAVLSTIFGVSIVGVMVYFFQRDTAMMMALGAALGTIGALPAWCGMIIAQISLNRVWSHAVVPLAGHADSRLDTCLRFCRRQLAVSLVCLVLLVAFLPFLTYAAVRLKRSPTKATRQGVTWAEESRAASRDVNTAIAVLQARLDRLADLGFPESPVVQSSRAPGEFAEVLVPPLDNTGLDLLMIDGILSAENTLELKEVVAGPFASKDEMKTALPEGIPEGGEILKSNSAEQYFVCHKEPVLTGRAVLAAKVVTDSESRSAISVQLTEQGGETMRAYSESHRGKQLAIVLDGKLVSAPSIQSVMSRDLLITGQFKLAEVMSITLCLRAGMTPLPSPVRLGYIESNDVPYSRWAHQRALHLGFWALVSLLTGAVFYRFGRPQAAKPESS